MLMAYQKIYLRPTKKANIINDREVIKSVDKNQ